MPGGWECPPDIISPSDLSGPAPKIEYIKMSSIDTPDGVLGQRRNGKWRLKYMPPAKALTPEHPIVYILRHGNTAARKVWLHHWGHSAVM
jgi:hypothetical protein